MPRTASVVLVMVTPPVGTSFRLPPSDTVKVSLTAWPWLSVAVMVIAKSVFSTLLGGLPLKVRVTGSKLSQPGSGSPLERVAA